MRWVWLLLLLGGCLAGPTPAADGPLPLPVPLEPLCRGTTETAGGLCAHVLIDEGQFGEPFLLAAPDKPLVLAAQGVLPVIDGRIVGPIEDPRTEVRECTDWGICLFIEDDAGWRIEEAIGSTAARIDPTLTWAGDRLLVAGLTNDKDIVVLASDDQGATFEDVLRLDAVDFDDRPWMANHGNEVAIVWQEFGEPRGFVSFSHDQGTTWTEPRTLPCNVFSTPVWRDGWLAACPQEDSVVISLSTGDVLQRLDVGAGTHHLLPSPELTVATGSGAWFGNTAGQRWSLAQQDHHWLGWTTLFEDLILSIVWDDPNCNLCPEAAPTKRLVQTSLDGQVVSTIALDPWMGGDGPDKESGEFDAIACAHTCRVAWMDNGRILWADLGR